MMDAEKEANMAEYLKNVPFHRSLLFVCYFITLVTIGPAVVVGIVWLSLDVRQLLAPGTDTMVFARTFGSAALVKMPLVALLIGSPLWVVGFRRYVIKPLHRVGKGLVAGASGDLSVHLDVNRDDEMGLLAGQVNRVLGNLNLLVKQLKESSEQVSGAAQQLSNTSSDVNASAQGVSASVQQISKGAELQAEKVQETARAMHHMAEVVHEVAGAAQIAAEASEEAAGIAESGEVATLKAMAKINQAREVINKSASTVLSLGELSGQVGKISDVITGIADQTNLLALNAAIEAARAGESGRGFAVVAEEVKKLAEGSAAAAEQIAQLIRDVQTQTGNAVAAMEAGKTQIEEGTEVMNNAGEALKKITRGVRETSRVAQQIKEQIQEQMANADMVEQAMSDISAVVEQNAASVEETAAATEEQTACMEEVTAAAQELAGMAQQLDSLIHRFRV